MYAGRSPQGRKARRRSSGSVLSLLALGSSLAWGTADFFAGVASRRRPAIAVVGWTQTAALALLTVLVLAGWGRGSASGWVWWSAGAGLAGMVGLLAFYTALSTGTMGVVAPIAALGVIVPVILGVATGDQPSAWAWVGMVIAILGVTLASGPELSGAVSVRPVLLAGIAAVGFGLALFCLDRGARSSTLMTLWGMRVTSVTILLLVALFARSVGGEIRWCNQWQEHPEALTRLEALWRSWEALRLDTALGVATWLTSYLDPQLATLFGRSGTFTQCTPARHVACSQLGD